MIRMRKTRNQSNLNELDEFFITSTINTTGALASLAREIENNSRTIIRPLLNTVVVASSALRELSANYVKILTFTNIVIHHITYGSDFANFFHRENYTRVSDCIEIFDQSGGGEGGTGGNRNPIDTKIHRENSHHRANCSLYTNLPIHHV